MELFETNGSLEKRLVQKAERAYLPIGGTIELLPLCNMSCSMCYVQDNAETVRQKLLRTEEWMGIAHQLKAAGTLFLLLTGGEPLLHPDFKEIYTRLLDMGFILTLNTNGTLLDEEWADFFAAHPCRRINISLYGASNETYAKLCHNPHGFDQTMRALRLLKERNQAVRISVSLVRENRDDLPRIVEIANELGFPFMPAAYMFPPTRRGCGWERFAQSRMSPREAAVTRIRGILLKNPQADPQQQAKMLIDQITGPVAIPARAKGFSCRAASCGFWINWRGELRPCGMMDIPGGSLENEPLIRVWAKMVADVSQIETCSACKTCRKKVFCQTCAAASVTETGTFDGKPQYLCDVTDEMIKVLLESLNDEDRASYTEKVKAVFPELL